MKRLPTASELPRVAACPASASLPRIERTSVWSEAGDARHSYLCNVTIMGRDEALAMVPSEYRAACEAIDTDKLPVHLDAEVTFAYDLETGAARVLGAGLRRDYSARRPTEIVGTADLVGIREMNGERQVYIPDYKGAHARIPRARDNWQTRFLAMAAARAYRATSSREELIHLSDDGDAWHDVNETAAEELAETEAGLRDLIARAEAAEAQIEHGETPTFSMGDHCRWCPSFRYCPAQTALLRAVVNDSEGFAHRTIAGLMGDEAQEAYARWRAAGRVFAELGDSIKELARVAPIPAGEGKFYAATMVNRDELDGATAQRILDDAYGPSVAGLAVKIHTSKTAIEQAFRAVDGPKGAAGEARNAVDLIRAAGGVATTNVERVAEVKAERLAQDALVAAMAGGVA